MGHHFDSPESRADSRINITDNFIFESDRPDRVAAIVAVSPLAGLPSPYHGELQARTFRPGCAYDLRFDTNADARVDRIVRFVFDEPNDGGQRWTASLLEGETARDHHGNGHSIGSGTMGETTSFHDDWRVWIGDAGDPFWLDAVAAKTFISNLKAGAPWNPDTFSSGSPTTACTNVIAIALEFPRTFLGSEPIGFFSTVSANDHGHWTQVQRCGRPNFAATFIDDPALSALYNRSDPHDDIANFGSTVANEIATLVRAARTARDPEGYGELAVHALLPDVIRYDASRKANFGFGGINGRTLNDDFGAVVYSTVFNFPMRTGIAQFADLRSEWPFLPLPRPLPSGAAIAVPTRNA